ncbi:MAG: PAS domain S-box protein [Bacteroidales bacterium]|nr:PAS domain S-box protein [Bacteroidales bacterium]
MKNQKDIEQLQQTIKFYETLLRVSNDGILITDASRNIIEVNDAFCSFIGQKRKVIIGSDLFKWLEIFSEDAAENWIKLEKTVQSKQVVSNYEIQFLLNNEIRYFGVNASLLEKIEYEEKGVIISNWHDITERKKTEQALGKSEEKFRLITENTSDVVTLQTFDLKASYTYVSPSIKAMSGYEPEEMLGRSVFEFIHPDDKKNLLPLLKKYVNLKIKKLLTGKKFFLNETIEFRCKDKSGNWRYAQSTANIVGNQLLFVSRDITERKKAEDTLKQSEKNYRDIFNNATDAIYIQDREGRFLDVNLGAMDMYGYPKEFFLGKTPGFLSAPGKNDLKKIAGFVEDAFNDKTRQYDFWGIRKNGEVFPKIVRSQKGIYMGKEVVVTFALDITERRLAEEALKESEEKYRLLAETSKDVIIVLDLKGNIKYINQEGINLSGYSKKEALKMNVKDVLSEDKVSLIDKNFAKRIAGDKSLFMYEIDFFNKKGDKIPVEIKSSLITEHGKPSGVLLTARDIIERKKMEKELIRLSNAFRMSSDSITISDLEGKITDVNEATLKMFGTDDKADLIGKNSLDLLASEDKVKAVAIMKELMKKGYSKDDKYNVILKDGSKIPVEMSTSIMKGMEGKPIGFVGITRDITERKQAEEALQESEKQLKTLIDTMPDFVCFKDGDGHWLMANEACIRVFRLENIDYRGKKDSELAKLNSHLRDSFLTCEKSDARVWKEGRLFHGEETISDPDGSIRVYDVTKVPVSHPDGERKGLVVLGHDITERKQADEELKKHREHLEELVKERTAELEEKNEKLEYFNKLFVGREFRIKELRDKVKELEEKISDS